MSYELGKYIKVVIDVEKGILAGGGGMHYDEEQQNLVNMKQIIGQIGMIRLFASI